MDHQKNHKLIEYQIEKKMFRRAFLQHCTTNPFSRLAFRNISYHQTSDLDTLRNKMEQLVKQVKAEKPNIPPPLQQDNSALAMIFENGSLRESISLGPTFPANKYKKYEETIDLPPKRFVFYAYKVLSLLTYL